jgi:hypothetical protein
MTKHQKLDALPQAGSALDLLNLMKVMEPFQDQKKKKKIIGRRRGCPLPALVVDESLLWRLAMGRGKQYAARPA